MKILEHFLNMPVKEGVMEVCINPLGVVVKNFGEFGKRHRSDGFNLLAGLSAITNFAQSNEVSSDELCRDFEKGNCSRGNRCKYFHPKLKICRDFQNKKM